MSAADRPRQYHVECAGAGLSVSFDAIGESAVLRRMAANIDAAITSQLHTLESWLGSHSGDVPAFEVAKAGDFLAGVRVLHLLAAGMRQEAAECEALEVQP